ncbi:MAG TPA: hypothetical protein VFF11_13690, partial [Candidatus Binatia bacterium]|nr:hypothetical protein [Candidatus Binatia bacterium]
MKNVKFFTTLLLAFALPKFALADLAGPYTPDANTLYLVHLDEPSGGSVATNTGSRGGVFITATNTTSGNGLALPPSVTTLLGYPSFSGFNKAVSGTNVDGQADAVIGYDGNNNGVFDGDVQGGQASLDGIAMTNLNIGVGGASPFTLEALIRPGNITANQEIICSDSYHVRGFQFKITSVGQLQFQYITAPTVNLTVA